MAVASNQGQKIYALKSSNQAIHSTLLQGLQLAADVRVEIANALAIGQEVTLHEKDVVINGWSGSGYVLIDPDTGAGAYKISGGANGGVYLGWGAGALLPLALLGIIVGATELLVIGATAAVIVPFVLSLILLTVISMAVLNAVDEAESCFFTGFALGLGAMLNAMKLGTLTTIILAHVVAFPNVLGTTQWQTCLNIP